MVAKVQEVAQVFFKQLGFLQHRMDQASSAMETESAQLLEASRSSQTEANLYPGVTNASLSTDGSGITQA